MMVESRADREGEGVEWFDWKVGLIDSNFITNETAVEWQASPDGIVLKPIQPIIFHIEPD